MSKLYATMIPGGRAGEQMRTYTIDLTELDLNDEDTVEDLMDGEYGPYLAPNLNKDRKTVIAAIKGCLLYTSDAADDAMNVLVWVVGG